MITRRNYLILFILFAFFCSKNEPTSPPEDESNDDPQQTIELATKINNITYINSSFKVSWSSVNHEDFLKYQLFTSSYQDTSTWDKIFETEHARDTVYWQSDIPKDVYQYFKVSVVNKDTTAGKSDTRLASSYRLIAYPRQENYYSDTWLYIIDINGRCMQKVPNSKIPYYNRYDPYIFFNDKIISIKMNAGENESSSGLYSMDIDGTNFKQITSQHAENPVPIFSQNRLVYITWEGPPEMSQTNGDLWSANIDGSDPQNLTINENYIVAKNYKPSVLNNNRILFTEYNQFDSYKINIKSIDLDGSNYQLFLEQASNPVVSSDSRWLLYSGTNGYILFDLTDSTSKEVDLSFTGRNIIFNPEATSIIYGKGSIFQYDLISDQNIQLGVGTNPYFIDETTLIWHNMDSTLTVYDLESTNARIITIGKTEYGINEYKYAVQKR